MAEEKWLRLLEGMDVTGPSQKIRGYTPSVADLPGGWRKCHWGPRPREMGDTVAGWSVFQQTLPMPNGVAISTQQNAFV